MKIKEGFELRKVGDDYVVITVGDATSVFNGMIKLNYTGMFIFQELKKGVELNDLIDAFAKEFSIDKELATKDVNAFIENIKPTNCFEN